MKSISAISLICLLSSVNVSADEIQDLRAVLESHAGQSSISIPHGEYLIDFSATSSPISFRDLHDVVIDFNGSTVICNKQMQAFNVSGCKNVVIRNFTLEYDPPTCTQGTITAIDGSTWDVTLHQNYPDKGVSLRRTQVYDSETRELIRNFTTLWETSQTLVWTGERTLRLSGVSNPAVKVGDYVVLTVLPDSYTPHAIYLTNCTDCKLESITVYDSNCFSFFESDCERTHYYRCAVTRKINDPKFPDDRLRAGFADGIHSKHAKVGPIIEECVLEHSGDDCIAINGSFYPVYRVNEADRTLYILTAEDMASKIKPKKEDTLVVISNRGTRRGQSPITNISTAYPTASERSACFSKLTNIREQQNYTNGAKIVLSEWIDGIGIGDMVYSNDRIGSGFKVINNKVGHNRSRAILIKASDGKISGNTIEHSAMSAIAIAPEFYWLEAGCSQNLEIADNRISDCMYDASMTSTSQAASITVVAEAPNGKLADCGAFSDIHIHGNIIEDCPFPAVFLNSIDGGYYYDNTIDATPSFTRRHGVNFGIPSTRPDYIFKCNISRAAPEASVTQSQADKITVNIANGRLSLSCLDADRLAQVSIMTLTGMKIGEWNVGNGEDIMVAGFHHGIYIASVLYGGIRSSHKIVL